MLDQTRANPPGMRVASEPCEEPWWTYPFLLAVLVPFFIVVVPPFAVWAWRVDRRFRKFYQRSGRLLKWADARQRLVSGRGALIVEQAYKGTGYMWWVPEDLSAAPLAPASVLRDPHRSREDYERIFSESACRWCDAHLPRLADQAHLVQYDTKVWREWEDVLATRRAFVVPSDHTSPFTYVDKQACPAS